MALGTLLTATVKGEREGTAVVNILVDAPSSGVQEITLNALKITYEGDGDGLFDMVLQPSSCTIGIEVDREKDTWLDTFLNGIIGNENEYFIEVLRNGSREWIGKVLLDIAEIEDAPFYTYNMTATCGLGTLKDYDFDFALNPANGTYLVLGEVLRKALLPTYTDVAYSATDVYITSLINIFHDTNTALIGVKCPLEVTRVARVSLIEDVEENEPLTCADVIERILRPFGARIRMQNGCWHLISVIPYTQPLITVYNYGNRDYSLGPVQVITNLAHEESISTGNLIDTISGNTFTYKPALVRVDVKYKPESKFVLQKAYNTAVFYPNFDVRDLATNPIKISGKIQYEVPRIFNGVTNAVNGTVRLTFIVKAMAGATQKYRLDYTAQSGFYWTTNLNSVCVYDFSPVTDSRAVDEQSLSIDMPILVDASITNLSFEIYVNNLATSCSQALDWGCTLVAEQLFDNGTYEDDIAYTTDNTVLTNNSVYKEYELYHADNSNSLVLSAFQAKSSPGAVWANSSGWVLDYSPTSPVPIGQLLSKQIMNFGRVANKTYQCTLYYGNQLTMFNTLVYGAEKYFINSGEFDYKTNDFTGDIIQINPILTGGSSSTGTPYRGGFDRLRGQVQDVVRNIADIDTRAGIGFAEIRKLTGRIQNIENALTRTQPALVDILDFGEGYTPGTPVNVKIQVNPDGTYTLTTG